MALSTIKAALDNGINFFDTAEVGHVPPPPHLNLQPVPPPALHNCAPTHYLGGGSLPQAYAVDGFPNQAEVIVGKALAGRRSEAIIAVTTHVISTIAWFPWMCLRVACLFLDLDRGSSERTSA